MTDLERAVAALDELYGRRRPRQARRRRGVAKPGRRAYGSLKRYALKALASGRPIKRDRVSSSTMTMLRIQKLATPKARGEWVLTAKGRKLAATL